MPVAEPPHEKAAILRYSISERHHLIQVHKDEEVERCAKDKRKKSNRETKLSLWYAETGTNNNAHRHEWDRIADVQVAEVFNFCRLIELRIVDKQLPECQRKYLHQAANLT